MTMKFTLASLGLLLAFRQGRPLTGLLQKVNCRLFRELKDLADIL